MSYYGRSDLYFTSNDTRRCLAQVSFICSSILRCYCHIWVGVYSILILRPWQNSKSFTRPFRGCFFHTAASFPIGAKLHARRDTIAMFRWAPLIGSTNSDIYSLKRRATTTESIHPHSHPRIQSGRRKSHTDSFFTRAASLFNIFACGCYPGSYNFKFFKIKSQSLQILPIIKFFTLFYLIHITQFICEPFILSNSRTV